MNTKVTFSLFGLLVFTHPAFPEPLSDSGAGNVGEPQLTSLKVAATPRAVANVGPTSVHYVNLNNPTPISPFVTWDTAATNIQAAVDAAASGDEILVTNGVYNTGGVAVYGAVTNRVAVTKPVTVKSVNGSEVTIIDGMGMVGMRCVYLTNGAILDGFTVTNGFALNSGDALLERSGGGIWCESTNAIVANCLIINNFSNDRAGGVYGGTLNNCTIVRNSASSISGGTGAGAYGSTLYSCTLSNNYSLHPGAGANSCILNNCILSGNSSRETGGGAFSSQLDGCLVINNFADAGGGAIGGTLNNCIVTGNSANTMGGGVLYGVLNNCIVSGNNAQLGGGIYGGTSSNCTLIRNRGRNFGGGAYSATLMNCIIYNNSCYSRPEQSNYLSCAFYYCCTAPAPEGEGNFASPPLFIDEAGGDFHLQPNSPCINAGNNLAAPALPDLDGNPRIVGGTVDLGAYEFQSPSSVVSYYWLQQYGFSMDGSADFTDPDGDHVNNWQEWIAGTDPTNALSVFRMSNPVSTNSPTNLDISWSSVTNRTYLVQRGTNLGGTQSFLDLKSNIVGQPISTTYRDTNAIGNGPFFYRVRIE
jgi:hypothetical protein